MTPIVLSPLAVQALSITGADAPVASLRLAIMWESRTPNNPVSSKRPQAFAELQNLIGMVDEEARAARHLAGPLAAVEACDGFREVSL